jgi:hypothetical protein
MNYTFVSKYARWIPEKKRRETWYEAVDRVKQMMVDAYVNPEDINNAEINEYISKAYEDMKKKKILGSQRALQFGGSPIFKHNARIYNCIASYVDRVRFFQECMYLLLCGCGTGFSVQKHHIDKMPSLIKEKSGSKKFIIEDSIEGWSDAVGVLISSYFHKCDLFPEYNGKNVVFDYSKIRQAGSYLKSSGGKAPGPEPLKKALNNIKKVLDNAVKSGRDKIKPIEAYDIVMFSADAVISGGVRRSATICVFSADDDEMAKAKTGSWFIENPQRGRSNNSAMLIRNETTKEQFAELMNSVKEFGEPGFVWSDSKELIVNPCVLGDSLVTTDNGVSLVNDLIGKPFNALVDGKAYPSLKGFWKTGHKEVIELEFASGRKLRVTPNHKIMTTKGWKEAKDINSLDEVVVHNHRTNNIEIDTNTQEYKQGYLLGSFLGDGNYSKESAQLKWWGEDKDSYRLEAFEMMKDIGWLNNHHSETTNSISTYSSICCEKLLDFATEKDCMVGSSKRLTKKTIAGNWNHISGLIGGYFDADGTVSVNHEKGCSLRIWSVQLDNLENLQIALNTLGIYSKIYKDRISEGFKSMPDGSGGSKEYFCQTGHELVISCDNIGQFQKLVPLHNKDKQNKLEQIVSGYKRLPNRTHFVDKLIHTSLIGEFDVYDCTVEDIHAFDNDSVYVHNCVEIGMWPVDEVTGETGWQACNLSTINCAKLKTAEDFYEACESAAIIGTLQAGFTKFPYLGEVSERIISREALLGVSMTGVMEQHEICLDQEVQKKGAKIVKDVNAKIAKLIGINQAARTTCVKPEGTSSCILGTSSGIHPHHAKRYIRRVQANKMEPIYQYFKEQNPRCCEESVWSNNDSDDVVAFCVEVPDGSKLKNQVNAIELLKYVKSTQQNWVITGTNKNLCTQPWLVHNVSNTINVKPEEWDDVTEFIYTNRKYFCGVSLLPIAGDKDYAQAPFTTIYLPSEQIQYYGDAAMFVSGLIEVGLQLYEDNLWAACDSLLGFGQKVKGTEKKAYLERCQKFADRYMNGDLKQLTYCMKDVYNWKDWLDMMREYKEVDYTNVIEEQNNVKAEQEWACSGGKCDLV